MTASIFSALSSPSTLWFWELVEAVSIVVIGAGCWGESHWSEDNELPENPNSLIPRKYFSKKYRRWSANMVVGGLAIELFAFGFAFLASNREIEGLRSTNFGLEKQVLALEQQMAQTSTNLENLDPSKKPITSVYAYVSFWATFTNAPIPRVPPGRVRLIEESVTDGAVGELSFFNSTNRNVVTLILKSPKVFVRPFEIGGDWTIFSGFMQFEFQEAHTHKFPTKFETVVPLQLIGVNVDILDKLDSASLKLFIKPIDGRIEGATATLVINSTPRQFLIRLRDPSVSPMIISN